MFEIVVSNLFENIFHSTSYNYRFLRVNDSLQRRFACVLHLKREKKDLLCTYKKVKSFTCELNYFCYQKINPVYLHLRISLFFRTQN